MRPTIPQSNVPSSPSPDPAASLALVAVLFLGLVAVEYPLWIAGAAAAVVTVAAIQRTARVLRDGHVCLPRTDVCYRVVTR